MGRFVYIMLDGAGVGALPDAADYGDAGSDTLGNLSRIVDVQLPNFQRLGLGNILPMIGVPPAAEPLCLSGRLAPRSAGKDTTVGHWEHMGLVTTDPFPTYPGGFPEEVIVPFTQAIGRGILGNIPASGTAIIATLGEDHLATGRPIVYTSADSVFQIAAHVEIVPLEQLYAWCEIARGLLRGRHAVARVIARPFGGASGAFVRTKDRRDFSLAPTGTTYLNVLCDAGVPVLALGKISEVFAGSGVSAKIEVASNDENLALVLGLLRGESSRARFREGLLITNLVDFDMLWGHRNDVEGFARGLEAVDAALPDIVAALGPDDRLLLTADHGVDPTTPSTDHSREYVPLLFYPRPEGARAAVYEGMFSDTGATVCGWLTGQEPTLAGSALDRLSPARGWRRYTPVQVSAARIGVVLPTRVGTEEAKDAGRWLRARLGVAPKTAVILGSGLMPSLTEPVSAEVPYAAVPHWRAGSVAGHPQVLALTRCAGRSVALLRGRIHEYEGYDLSEVQLEVRSLAAWGVRDLVLTSASGAVSPTLAAGQVVMIGEVLDLQHGRNGEEPERVPVPDFAGASAVHASVPGPQYETPAELAVLRELGVATVSMSPAAELMAARDLGLRVAVMAVVVNVGDTDHQSVLAGATSARRALSMAVDAVLAAWV